MRFGRLMGIGELCTRVIVPPIALPWSSRPNCNTTHPYTKGPYPMKRIILSLFSVISLAIAGCGTVGAQVPSNRDTRLEVSRAIQIFRDVLTGTTTLYVDTVKVREITTRGINAMLSQLDPYTNYLPEVEKEDFAFMTTGEYAGIGAYIQQVDSIVYVQYPMPGSPAEKAGFKPGDAFVEINGKSMIPSTARKISETLKGPVGTEVRVKVRPKEGTGDKEFTITRGNVTVDQVVYKGIFGDGIGFIRLNSFTDKSAKDVRNAYEALAKEATLKGLILDLRSNGGGVLDGAIDILGMFLPKGTEVLTTKGRLPQTAQSYKTTSEPLSTSLPLAVLINGGSASASEILGGTLQDLDRAVLVGSKSFGKGLVQTTRPVSYDGLLKVTVSRYYIPSGRCIQQLDYSHRNPDGTVAAVPDSLTKVFHTRNGREVRDGGGIRPDKEVKDEVLSAPVYSLVSHGKIYMFARDLATKRPTPKTLKDVEVTDKDFEDFLLFLEKGNFEYGKMSLTALDRLKELAEFEGYLDRSQEAFEALKKELTPDLRMDLTRDKEQIKGLIRAALAVYTFGMEGQFAVNIESDPTISEAVKILSSPEEYRSILNTSPEKK